MSDSKYDYPVEACDVSDPERLRLYREKRSEWLYLMNDDPDHAVWRQITTMLWNDAVFRMTNEARRLAIEGKRASAALNGPLAQFINQGFVATQTLSIRRLMDQANRKPDRQIISLQRVLADIRAHRELITREHYVAYDALPYDPEPARQRHFKQIVAENTEGISSGWLPTTGPEAFNMAEHAHKSFDRLSGTCRGERGRHDLIRVEVFENLETVLTKSDWKDIAKFGDKFIAHAADAHSRGLLRDGQTASRSIGSLVATRRYARSPTRFTDPCSG